MRALVYRMSNGTVVKTLAEARKLGQPFTAKMETVPEKIQEGQKILVQTQMGM